MLSIERIPSHSFDTVFRRFPGSISPFMELANIRESQPELYDHIQLAKDEYMRLAPMPAWFRQELNVKRSRAGY